MPVSTIDSLLFAEFINGLETDKAHPFIEDCIAKQESLVKVLSLRLFVLLVTKVDCTRFCIYLMMYDNPIFRASFFILLPLDL
jgi:hypothetical protein